MTTVESSPAVVEAARRLYGQSPAEFIATRKSLAAAAKASGDKDAATEIGRLRKPDGAAWAVNIVVRERADAVADLVGLGARMRSAQAALDVATLQDMRVERDRAVDALVTAAVEVVAAAGSRLTPAAQDAVRGTAIAVLADAGASDAVASGLLTKPLSYSGFGEVDVSDAVAVTGSGVVLTALRGGGESQPVESRREKTTDRTGANAQRTDARQPETHRLEARRRQARAALESAVAAETSARADADQAAERVTTAEAALDEARRRYDEALREADAARTSASQAREVLATATRARAEAETEDARARRG